MRTFVSGMTTVVLAVACAVTASCNRSSASDSPEHLRIVGTTFVTSAERSFQWRGITTFRLLEYVARGKDADVERFLSWAEGQRLTVIRVLAMGQGFMLNTTSSPFLRAHARMFSASFKLVAKIVDAMPNEKLL